MAFSANGAFRQGMNTTNQTARRYHWSDKINLSNRTNFVNEPHKDIVSQKFLSKVLNLSSKKAKNPRQSPDSAHSLT